MMFCKTVEAVTGLKVYKELEFAPPRKWRFDYYIPSPYMIAIEVEGGTFKETWYTDKKTGERKCHTGGRHNTGKGFLEDMQKYNTATILGWRLIRVTPEQLMTNETIEAIKKIVELKTV